MDRRNFLVAAAAGAAACSRRAEDSWRVLNANQAATLEALCECLIPEDADSGAKGARVVRYLDAQLAGKYKRHRKTYARAIDALNELARQRQGHDFAALSLDIRSVLVGEFEQGENRGAFNLILDHTMQGFYGNPRHGGNAGFASWRMMGVSPLPVRGRLQYQISQSTTATNGPERFCIQNASSKKDRG